MCMTSTRGGVTRYGWSGVCCGNILADFPRDERGEYEFLDWIESLREGPIVLEDLRDEVDQWLTWPDRRFDRQIFNDRLRRLQA